MLRGVESPAGLAFVPELVDAAGQAALLAVVRAIPLEGVELRGQVARRKVAHLGLRYAYRGRSVAPGPPLPPALVELRARAAAALALDPAAFVQALVTWYPPGAGIGWHRDAPAFGDVVLGISVAGAARLRLRHASGARFELPLPPGSLYALSGAARSEWEHHLPPAHEERWSITYRTLARVTATRRGA